MPPRTRAADARRAQAARAARTNRAIQTGVGYRDMVLVDLIAPNGVGVAVSDPTFNTVHSVVTGYTGHFSIGITQPPHHHFATLERNAAHAHDPQLRNLINNVSAIMQTFFTRLTTLYGDPLADPEEHAVRFVTETVEQVMLAMNARNRGQGQVAAPGQVFQHLRTIQGRRLAMLTVHHQLQINLAQPIVTGRSDLVVFSRHGIQYLPLCVIEVKSGNVSSCGAVAEGLIAAAALGIHHNLPFVNGIATNLRRWTFFWKLMDFSSAESLPIYDLTCVGCRIGVR